MATIISLRLIGFYLECHDFAAAHLHQLFKNDASAAPEGW
jgi:hypothetical protein